MEVVVVLLSMLVMINIQVEATTMLNSRSHYQPNVVDSKIEESYTRDGHHIPIPDHVLRDGNEDDGLVILYQRDLNNGAKRFDLRTPIIENTQIIVSGEIESDGRITVILGSDSVTVCQVDVFYPIYGQPENKIETTPKPKDGETFLASDYFPNLPFSVKFKAYKIESQTLSIYIGESHLTVLHLNNSLQDVKFVSSTGHVKKVVRFM